MFLKLINRQDSINHIVIMISRSYFIEFYRRNYRTPCALVIGIVSLAEDHPRGPFMTRTCATVTNVGTHAWEHNNINIAPRVRLLCSELSESDKENALLWNVEKLVLNKEGHKQASPDAQCRILHSNSPFLNPKTPKKN